jgi:hypothetical protein
METLDRFAGNAVPEALQQSLAERGCGAGRGRCCGGRGAIGREDL